MTPLIAELIKITLRGVIEFARANNIKKEDIDELYATASEEVKNKPASELPDPI